MKANTKAANPRTLLFDIGNTHTHVGVAANGKVLKQLNVPTIAWGTSLNHTAVRRFAGKAVHRAAICSVVPKATPHVMRFIRSLGVTSTFELTAATTTQVGIDYPHPKTIGADRLANAIAATSIAGAPVVVVDFGTAVTFDVVNSKNNYVGGIIAPGLSAMTEYLHEKTALLPRVRIREVHGAIGKNTAHAMLIGAVHGYRGLIKELLIELKRELKVKHLRVLATGGCAALIAKEMPEITAVEPLLTLQGLLIASEG